MGMSEVFLAVGAMSGIEIGAGALDVLDACAENIKCMQSNSLPSIA